MTTLPVTGSGAPAARYVVRAAVPALRATWVTEPAWKHGTLDGDNAEGVGLNSTLIELSLSVNVTAAPESCLAHPSGTSNRYPPVGD
jgi:hypothetical protein